MQKRGGDAGGDTMNCFENGCTGLMVIGSFTLFALTKLARFASDRRRGRAT